MSLGCVVSSVRFLRVKFSHFRWQIRLCKFFAWKTWLAVYRAHSSLKRSLVALVVVYNLLPQVVVVVFLPEAISVLVAKSWIRAAQAQVNDWQFFLSPGARRQRPLSFQVFIR